MLSRTPKTPQPEWANPYVPTWEDGQWIVMFTNAYDAARGLQEMQPGTDEQLCAARYPNDHRWYVGVAD